MHYHGNGASKSYYKMYSFMIFYNLSVDALSRLYLKLGVTVKGIVHPKNVHSVIIYSPSSSSRMNTCYNMILKCHFHGNALSDFKMAITG